MRSLRQTSTIALSVAAAALILMSPARADDAGDCEAGIKMITSELERGGHPQATGDALKTALRVAKREMAEQEYDECLDAVADANKALKK